MKCRVERKGAMSVARLKRGTHTICEVEGKDYKTSAKGREAAMGGVSGRMLASLRILENFSGTKTILNQEGHAGSGGI